MNVPATIQQLLIILVAVLPGVVYQTVRASLVGPSPHNSDGGARVLRALGASVVFDALYMVAFGPWLIATAKAAAPSQPDWRLHVRELAVAAVGLVVLIPAVVAVVSSLRRRGGEAPAWVLRLLRGKGQADGSDQATRLRRWVRQLADRAENLGYTPTPTWDFAFTERADVYVRIFTKSGYYIGGYYGSDSFVASYPETPAVYLQETWRLGESGEFAEKVKGGRGVYIDCSDIVSLEFLTAHAADETTDDMGEDPGGSQDGSLDTEQRDPDNEAEEER